MSLIFAQSLNLALRALPVVSALHTVQALLLLLLFTACYALFENQMIQRNARRISGLGSHVVAFLGVYAFDGLWKSLVRQFLFKEPVVNSLFASFVVVLFSVLHLGIMDVLRERSREPSSENPATRILAVTVAETEEASAGRSCRIPTSKFWSRMWRTAAVAEAPDVQEDPEVNDDENQRQRDLAWERIVCTIEAFLLYKVNRILSSTSWTTTFIALVINVLVLVWAIRLRMDP